MVSAGDHSFDKMFTQIEPEVLREVGVSESTNDNTIKDLEMLGCHTFVSNRILGGSNG